MCEGVNQLKKQTTQTNNILNVKQTEIDNLHPWRFKMGQATN